MCCIFRTVNVNLLSKKLNESAVRIALDLLKNVGFEEMRASSTSRSNMLFLPRNVSSLVVKVELRQLVCRLDDYSCMIGDSADMANEICKMYETWMQVSGSSSSSSDKRMARSITFATVKNCLQHLESPEKLHESLTMCYRKIKHTLGVLSNKQWQEKDTWRCWVCGIDNSILHDIECTKCGGMSVNPCFFKIQTESPRNNGTLFFGTGKLAMYNNVVK